MHSCFFVYPCSDSIHLKSCDGGTNIFVLSAYTFLAYCGNIRIYFRIVFLILFSVDAGCLWYAASSLGSCRWL